MPQNLTNGKSTLVQMMAWCRQTAGHYLSQCQWPRFMSPYGVTSSQWVNWVAPGANRKNSRGIFEIIFTTSWQLPETGIKKMHQNDNISISGYNKPLNHFKIQQANTPMPQCCRLWQMAFQMPVCRRRASLYSNVCESNFIPHDLMNKLSSVYIMAWHRTGGSALPQPKKTKLVDKLLCHMGPILLIQIS